ncbi:DnaD domain-containing protein [Lactiplantibacillus plantarum]|uniref:DnaD domain-containing protein n=1 Tax=Lactiplantibacillus plantarum TaxID=1590 RepID=UPI00223EAD76|nr:DnaD domain protein [Lactiplantibacillus plantarum]
MAIIRGKRDTNFTIMRNEGLQDVRLSFKARGLMAYMLSLPDDWKFYVKELVKHSDRDGRDAVLSGLKELEKVGYLQRTTHRNKGKFDSVDYLLVDVPVSTPQTENPDTDNPTPDKPDTENPQLQSTNGTEDLPVPSTDDTNDDDEGNTQPIDPIKKSWTQVWENDPNQVVGTQLREWSQTIGPDLVCYAITVAGEHSVKVSGALKYLSKVISGWQDRQVATLEQAKQLAAEHDKKQHHDSSKKRSRKARKEITPSWMNEDGSIKTGEKSKDTLTDEQRKKLDEMLAHMDKGGDVVGA